LVQWNWTVLRIDQPASRVAAWSASSRNSRCADESLAERASCSMPQEQQPVLVGSRQQPRPGHRRERDRVDELGVVVEAVALIGVGPGPVEHVLAVRVVLQVERAGGDELAAALEGEEVRRPAGGADRALRLVQRAQVGERDKGRRRRLRREQRRPGVGVDRRGIVEDPQEVVIGSRFASLAQPRVVAHRRKFRPSPRALPATSRTGARVSGARHCPKLGRI
jgi:hypothetical protein